VPQEVEAAIDKRSSMAAVGNLNDFVKYQMAKGMETGGAGAGGTAAELAVGFGMAQQMMQQGLMKPQADAAMAVGGAGSAAAGPAAPAVDLLGPADVAKVLGVTEADVMAVITSGELKAKKIGSSYRVTRAAIDAYLAQ
jgi:excisionase family DNA binding protein